MSISAFIGGSLAESNRLEATFEGSAASLQQCPKDDINEIAFVGRSNAGKSSTLNCLTGRNRLAKVSKTPGRTRLINLFSTTIGIRLVDLPGYGYAKASRSEQDKWNAMVNTYLGERENLVALVIVGDARHELKASDLQMLHWSANSELPTLMLLNKSDKLKRGAQRQSMQRCKEQLTPFELAEPLLFSATQKAGVDEALVWIRRFGQ